MNIQYITKKIKWFGLCVVGSSIFGCANPYAQFYHGDTPEQVVSKYGAQPEKQPQLRIVGFQDRHAVGDGLNEEGYMMVGWSSFNGKSVSNDLAIEKGKELHADIVAVASQYRNTNHTAVPIVTPTASTTYTTANVSAYGSGGYANAYGNGTSTTYGQQTTMIPVSTDIYETVASYWVKGKPRVFGANFRYANNEEKKLFGTNRGMVVSIVVRGSPAYLADIINGDLILKIGDLEINTLDDLKELAKYAGQEVPVVFIHGTQTMTKFVKLNSAS